MTQIDSKDTTAIITYNQKTKKIEGIIKIVIVTILILLIGAYISNVFEGTIIDTIISFIGIQFGSKTILGTFLIGTIGGLFFLSVPIEILYINAIREIQSPGLIAMHAITLIAGLAIAYSIDYLFGLHLSGFSKKLISAKQFYNIKAKLNRYGLWLILLFNITPLPSQALTFICGVFRYNKTRYAAIWATGWIIKITAISTFLYII
jgi:membrane protein YqaA with SNARE-associated domain